MEAHKGAWRAPAGPGLAVAAAGCRTGRRRGRGEGGEGEGKGEGEGGGDGVGGGKGGGGEGEGGEGEGEGGRACSIGVSCQPVMVPEPCSVSKVEIAPSSIAQYLVRYCGGRFNALATSDALTITVFLPLPRPSSLPVIGGIL